MKRLARSIGIICGIAFAVLLVITIINIVNNEPGFDYGIAAIVLLVLALGAERLGRS